MSANGRPAFRRRPDLPFNMAAPFISNSSRRSHGCEKHHDLPGPSRRRLGRVRKVGRGSRRLDMVEATEVEHQVAVRGLAEDVG